MQDAASQFVQLTWLFTTQPELLQVGQRIELPLALPTQRRPLVLRRGRGGDAGHALRPGADLPPAGRAASCAPNRELVAEVWFAPTLQYLPVRLRIRQDEDTYIDLMIDRLPLQAASRLGAALRARIVAADLQEDCHEPQFILTETHGDGTAPHRPDHAEPAASS